MSGRSRGVRKWMLAVAVAVSLAPILAVLALQIANASTQVPAPPTKLGPILRLHDLQIGYQGTIECSALEKAEEPRSELTKFIDGFKPRGCIAAYLRLFHIKGQEPDPPIVGSAVLEARSGTEADAALAVLPLLVARINDGHAVEEVTPTETIGDLTRVFHLGELETEDPKTETASALIWRSGDVLAGVLVAGVSAAANDRIASIYARRQQAHIEVRTPYTQAERDDTEAILDDPRLPVDVHWLGRHFEPSHGLRPSKLLYALLPQGDDGSDATLELGYSSDILIGSWTRAAWLHDRRTKLGHRVRDWVCTRTSTAPVKGGVATIYAGYRHNFANCPKQAPSVFFADVNFGRTVLSVGSFACVNCPVSSGGPYNSLRGVKAILRGLRLRAPAAAR